MLEVFTTDLASFEQLSNRHLTQLPGVKRVKSRFALRESHADGRRVTGTRDKTLIVKGPTPDIDTVKKGQKHQTLIPPRCATTRIKTAVI